MKTRILSTIENNFSVSREEKTLKLITKTLHLLVKFNCFKIKIRIGNYFNPLWVLNFVSYNIRILCEYVDKDKFHDLRKV